MKRTGWQTALALLVGVNVGCVPASIAGESTMPAGFVEKISPEMSDKYTFTEDGEFGKKLKLPIYEWMPTDGKPKAIVIGIHGLTLHGRRFRVLARSLATTGVGFVALDMRGFGRCKFDEKNQFSETHDDKTKVNHEKSYTEIVELLKLVRAKYPEAKLIAMGESLGCTFSVRLAAEHGDLVDGIVLGAPAVHLNAKMYATPADLLQGVEALLKVHHNVNLHGFISGLVSSRPEIVKEMEDDPHILKQLPLSALLSTDEFVGKTAHWGKGISSTMPVLILQGSADNCVSPKHVTDLMNNIPSNDQTLAWRGNYGHLQLETVYMRAQTIDALVNWLQNHSMENKIKLSEVEQRVNGLGGQIKQ